MCQAVLPGFPVAYIGFSLPYARRFLREDYSNVNFNLLQQMLVGPCGAYFMKAIRRAKRNLYVWTVNEEQWMEWSIRKQVDGVITDDPKLFLEVCDRYAAAGLSPTGASSSAEQGTTTTKGIHGGNGGGMWTKANDKLRRTRLYARAFFFQVAALVLTVVMWRRLQTLGTKKQGRLKA